MINRLNYKVIDIVARTIPWIHHVVTHYVKKSTGVKKVTDVKEPEMSEMSEIESINRKK